MMVITVKSHLRILAMLELQLRTNSKISILTTRNHHSMITQVNKTTIKEVKSSYREVPRRHLLKFMHHQEVKVTSV
jgi:hypothetical protein